MSLRALLARYLLATGALLALFAAAAWSLIVLLMNSGFLLPASSSQQAALQSAARLRQREAFDASDLDPLCGYVYFSGEGAVVQSNLSPKRLEDCLLYTSSSAGPVDRFRRCQGGSAPRSP